MAEVTMPRLSDTMEEGTIASWLKKPGEQVNKGDVIAQIETDKATMDLTAFESGTLQEILAPEGSTVQIGKPVARIGKDAAAPASSSPASSSPAAAPPASAPPTEPTPPSAESTPPSAASAGQQVPAEPKEPKEEVAEASAAERVAEAPAPDRVAEASGADRVAEASAPDRGISKGDEGPLGPSERQPLGGAQRSPVTEEANGKVRASPMARHIAAEHGLNLTEIPGSGPQGRVIRADVEAALSQPQAEQQPQPPPAAPAPAPAPSVDGDERVPLSQMRRTIARRMLESTRTIPHFFLTTVVDVTELARLRKQINDAAEGQGIKVSFNDMIVKAAALAIRKVPEVNVSFNEDSIIRHKHVHIGVAVATDKGLIVPVIRDVDQKSLGTIANEAHELAERASAGKLQPADYTGGTFTISNLGMFGIEHFTAVINPPEAAILAVGAIAREPAEHEGQIVLRDRMRLTLSVDHRALDGAIGSRYLQALKALLEKPMLVLV